MTRPEDRADGRQREAVRAELHAIVDRVVDGWPTIARQAREMTKGFAGGSGGGTSGGDGSDPTYAAATSAGADPAQGSAEWLAHLREFIGHAKTLDTERKRLMPLSAIEAEKLQTRTNTVDVCAECGDPVIRGKRLDGALLHNSDGDDPPCFDRARNRIQGRRPSKAEGTMRRQQYGTWPEGEGAA